MSRLITSSTPAPRAGELGFVLMYPFATMLNAEWHRFLGSDPEPRPGLSSGHIPHSVSLPFMAFLETHSIPESVASKIEGDLPMTYTRLRPTQGIILALEESLGPQRAKEVLEGKRRIVASCGSGMTAGVIWLGLKSLGVDGVGIYDEVRPSLRPMNGLADDPASRGPGMRCGQKARS